MPKRHKGHSLSILPVGRVSSLAMQLEREFNNIESYDKRWQSPYRRNKNHIIEIKLNKKLEFDNLSHLFVLTTTRLVL